MAADILATTSHSAIAIPKKRPAPTCTPSPPTRTSPWIGLSLMGLAAATLVCIGHWFSRRPGKRLGSGNCSHSGKKSDNESLNFNSQALSLDELRARRVEAAEARARLMNCGPAA